MNREEFLDSAKKCVCNDRESQYGNPEDNFSLIADLWNIYLHGKYQHEATINAADVAVLMALLKIARLATGKFKEDSYVDCIGYMACAGEIGSNFQNRNNHAD